MQFAQPKKQARDTRWQRHVAVLAGILVVALLLYGLSGGFPATTWRLFFATIFNFDFVWRERGANALIPLLLLGLQSFLLLGAWLLLLWVLYCECVLLYRSYSKGTRRGKTSAAGNTIPGSQVLALPEEQKVQTPLLPSQGESSAAQSRPDLTPRPSTIHEASSAYNSTRTAEKSATVEEPETPQRITRKFVAKPLATGYRTGNPFEGPGELPEVLREEELLARSGNDDTLTENGFKLGNPFDGPGTLPEILREEALLANPFDDHDIEEIEVVNGVSRVVPRSIPESDDPLANPFDMDDEDEMATTTQTGASSAQVNPLDNPFEGENTLIDTRMKQAVDDAQKKHLAASGAENYSTTRKPQGAQALSAIEQMLAHSGEDFAPPNLSEEATVSSASRRQGTEKTRKAPRTGTEHVKVASVTHTGIARAGKENEDSHYAHTAQVVTKNGGEKPVGLLLVADGMGGHGHGKYASSLVVNTIRSELETVLHDPEADGDTLKSRFVGAVQKANKRLFESNREAQRDCGTTLTGVIFTHLHSDKAGAPQYLAHVVNIGDSRTYWYNENKGLSQVTRDHSQVELLIEQKQLSEEQRYTDPRRHQIYRNLGHEALVRIDIFTIVLSAGDRLLLCSDGLWEMVRDDKLAKLLALPANEPSVVTTSLLQAALESGGADNVTAVVLLTTK